MDVYVSRAEALQNAREMKAEALAKAGREAVSRVLKGEEFTELQQRAEEKIAGLRRELTENGRLIEQADAILSELQLGATACAERRWSASTWTGSSVL
jgi:hypothetical protein